ncbi:MAG TPA: hypothetical protein VLI69_01925 [Gammaproteobacteria bacterium]|nr:hypothetical protein [Gammaproteobacteria bacterium]
MSEVELSLSPGGECFLKKLSSDEYEGLVFEAFFPADMLYTFAFRYPKLLWCDIPGDDHTSGFGIDYTMHNPAATIVSTLIVLAFAAANFYREYRKQKNAKDSNSYKNIYGQLNKEDDELAKMIERQMAAANMQKFKKEKAMEWMNRYLEDILQKDEELQKKYNSIKIANNKLVFDCKAAVPQAPEKPAPWYSRGFNWVNKKILGPAYETISISSFAYWLLWIGAGIYTGVFAAGVVGLSVSVMFGVPLAFGFVYPLVKTINYISSWWKSNALKNKAKEMQDPPTHDQVNTAKEDAVGILRRVILRRKYEFAKECLMSELDPDNKNGILDEKNEVRVEDLDQYAGSSVVNAQIASLTKTSGVKKAGMTFISSTMGTYVGVQYAAWITTDFLTQVASIASNIPVVNLIAGWALLAVSVARGIYKAATGDYARQKTKTQALDMLAKKQQGDFGNLELLYQRKLNNINELKKQLGPDQSRLNPMIKLFETDDPQFLEGKNPIQNSRMTSIKKVLTRALTFTNAVTTGAFVTRIFLIKGTAIFLPFAAAAFSNPVTIGLVIGIGLLYGAFAAYEHHLKRKEARAKEELKKGAERIDYLKQQIRVAELTERVLKDRVINLNNKAPVAGPALAANDPEVGLKNGAAPKGTTLAKGSMWSRFLPACCAPKEEEVLAYGQGEAAKQKRPSVSV